jgi:hypothetical protein
MELRIMSIYLLVLEIEKGKAPWDWDFLKFFKSLGLVAGYKKDFIWRSWRAGVLAAAWLSMSC